MKKQMKGLVVATALLASGVSLALAQTAPTVGGSRAAELSPSAVSGDLSIVRTPSGVAAYAETTAPVIRRQHKNKR